MLRKLDPFRIARNSGLNHCGVTVAEDHRPPGADEIEIAVAVDIEEIGAGAAGDE